jgi:antitoxin component YwqK of YwqJK toxin-antitoxin module
MLHKETNLPVTGFVVSYNEKENYLQYEHYYINGIRNGTSKWFNKDGTLSSSQEYIDGKLSGSYNSWYEDGRKSHEGYYSNDQLNGTVKSWYKNGRIKEISHYTDGKRIGWQRYFLEYGDVLYESNLVDGNGKVSFKIPEKEEVISIDFLDGKEVFPTNGSLKGSIFGGLHVIDRLISGSKGEVWYENGERIRSIRQNNDSEKPYSETNYKYGLQHGKEIRFHSNGQLSEEGTYYFGAYHGTWQRWFENGKLQEISKYDYGKLISTKCWDESGKSVDCNCYDNTGKKIKCP